jgi:hypothetical protein
MSFVRYSIDLLLAISFAFVLHVCDVNFFRSANEGAALHHSLSHGCSSLSANRGYFEAASAVGKKDGQGRFGWLFLLAGYDCDPLDEQILENLVDNYVRANYSEVAIQELLTLNKTHPEKAQRLLHSFRSTPHYSRVKQLLNMSFLPTAGELPHGRTSVLFPTLLGQYDFLEHSPELGTSFHDGFAKDTGTAYNELKTKLLGRHPDMSDTEINHQFFRWQMYRQSKDGKPWQGFADQRGFSQLLRMFKGAAGTVVGSRCRW